VNIIALDLEGTLISNAVSQIPRPHLLQLLEFCYSRFDRVVIYTTVPEILFRKIAQLLYTEKCVPEWFVSLDYVIWTGGKKDLSFISKQGHSKIWLVDDHVEYIVGDQMSQWIGIDQFVHPYVNTDNALEKIVSRITDRTGLV
jgi:hypothetical protein